MTLDQMLGTSYSNGIVLNWRTSDGWPRSRWLADEEVAEIRGALPFGPLTFSQIEEWARSYQLNPMTVLRIASGASYCRPAACPPGHPLRLALNAEAARKQRTRYRASVHRRTVGDAQGWRCRYCDTDIRGRGKSHLDHITPVIKGGTSDVANLQLLCRRCNIRKGGHAPSPQLDGYMERKITLDRTFEKLNTVLPSIVEPLLWSDTVETNCLWCLAETKRIDDRPSVFKCDGCRRIFRNADWQDKEDFYDGIRFAAVGVWYADEQYRNVVEAVMEDKEEEARKLIEEVAGYVQEVKRKRHSHAKGQGCWCEFGVDGFTVINVYQQSDLPHPISNLPLGDEE